jgi:hypothetical protein
MDGLADHDAVHHTGHHVGGPVARVLIREYATAAASGATPQPATATRRPTATVKAVAGGACDDGSDGECGLRSRA